MELNSNMWYITITNSHSRSKQVYWTQNISEHQLCHSKRGREDGEGKARARCLMRYHFPFFPIPWQGGYKYVHICNDQWSSKTPCDKYNREVTLCTPDIKKCFSCNMSKYCVLKMTGGSLCCSRKTGKLYSRSQAELVTV